MTRPPCQPTTTRDLWSRIALIPGLPWEAACVLGRTEDGVPVRCVFCPYDSDYCRSGS